jgi:hypothetical protein
MIYLISTGILFAVLFFSENSLACIPVREEKLFKRYLSYSNYLIRRGDMKKRKQRKNKLGKKLTGYSAAAGATLAVRKNEFGRKLACFSAVTAGAALAIGTTAADATSIFRPFNVTLTGTNASTYVDINADSVNDFLFGLNAGTASSFAIQVVADPLNAVAGTTLNAPTYAGTQTNVARNLPLSFQFISNNLFNKTATLIGSFYQGYYGTYTYGNFVGAGQRGHLGVSFDISGNTHFGWIDIEATADLHSLTIHGFAFEDDPGVGIGAGHAQISRPAKDVPEPGTLSLLAMGAAGLYAMRRRRRKAKDRAEDAA